jgi:hypothetical protein
MIVLPDVRLCSLVDKFKRIGGICYLHLQGRNTNRSGAADSYAALILLSVYVALLYLCLFWGWNVSFGVKSRLRCLTTGQPQVGSRQTILSFQQYLARFWAPPPPKSCWALGALSPMQKLWYAAGDISLY